MYIAKAVWRGNIVQPPTENMQVNFLKREARHNGTPIIVLEVKDGWFFRYNPPEYFYVRWPNGFFVDQLDFVPSLDDFPQALVRATLRNVDELALAERLVQQRIKG